MNTLRTALVFGLVVATESVASAQATTERVSVDSSGAEGNGHSGLYDPAHDAEYGIAISGDASVVAFASAASNLVVGDTNGKWDIFVHVRSTGVTERVSTDSSGIEANNHSIFPSSSVDGTCIAFQSDADNLLAGDTNGTTDVFLRDRASGTTERVSVDSIGNEANGWSYSASVSADGEIVAFASAATNLISGDSNNHHDVFVRDRSTGITDCVSIDSLGGAANGDSFSPSLSPDGRFVAFSSNASSLVANDTNGSTDVFVRDRLMGITERVSLSSSGIEGNDSSFIGRGPSVSADGAVVAFTSYASNFGGDSSSYWSQVYVRDRSTGMTEEVSILPPGFYDYDGSYAASLSADGQTVSFYFKVSLDLFVRDRSTAITELVSVDSSGNSGWGIYPSISADGQVVAFESSSSKLVPNDTNGLSDVFVHNRCAVEASWSNYGQGFPGTNGIPSFTAQSNPVRGSSITLDVGNSSPTFSFALLELGFQRADIPSSWGGELLVSPDITLVLGLSPSGTSLTGDLPHDDQLCGVSIDLQVIESDPGALKGVSFSPGLELLVGR